MIYNIVWNSVRWHDMTGDTVWQDLIRYCVAWYDTRWNCIAYHTMTRYAMLCYAMYSMQFYVLSFYTIPCYATLFCVCHLMSYHIRILCAMLSYIMSCDWMLHRAVLCRDTIRQDTTWHRMAQHDMTWHRVIWHDVKNHESWCDTIHKLSHYTTRLGFTDF